MQYDVDYIKKNEPKFSAGDIVFVAVHEALAVSRCLFADAVECDETLVVVWPVDKDGYKISTFPQLVKKSDTFKTRDAALCSLVCQA